MRFPNHRCQFKDFNSILTQVATYKILGRQTPFLTEIIYYSRNIVAQTFSLHIHRHKLKVCAT